MDVLQLIGKRSVLVFLLAGFFFAAGCSYTVKPRSVPLEGGIDWPQFAGVSVSIVNAEKDVAEARIRTDTGGNSPFKASDRAWAQNLAESLARELARRGADVRVGAPLTLSVAINDIIFVETRDSIEFNAKAALGLSSGWYHEYRGSAGAETSGVFSVSKEAERLAGRVVAEIVKAVISDNDFADQLKKK